MKLKALIITNIFKLCVCRCENVLGEFLRDIIKNPASADFSSMINILIVHSQPREEILQSSNFKQVYS